MNYNEYRDYLRGLREEGEISESEYRRELTSARMSARRGNAIRQKYDAKTKVITDQSVSQEQVQAPPEDKPIYTGLQPQPVSIAPQQQIRTFSTSRGVSGYEDPVAQQSVAAPKGNVFIEGSIRRYEQERYLVQEQERAQNDQLSSNSGYNRKSSGLLSNVSSGEVRAETFTESGIKGIPQRLQRKSSELQFQAEYRTESPLKRQLLFFGATGLTFGSKVAEPFIHPIDTAKGLFSSVTHPKETLLYTGEQLKTEPASLLGNIGSGLILGKAIETGASKLFNKAPKISYDTSVTKRTITDTTVRDFTKVKAEAVVGNRKLEFSGAGTQEFKLAQEGEFTVKGESVLTEKTTGTSTTIETRGIAKGTEASIDTITYNKITTGDKVKNIVDVTQTQKITTDPLSFRSFSRSLSTKENIFDAANFERTSSGSKIVDINKQFSPENLKPESVSVGATREVYVQDMFTQKNMFSKDIVSESGSVVAKEQLLETGRVNVGADTLFNEFEMPKPRDISRTAAERKAFDPVFQSSTRSGSIALKQQITGKTIPVTQESMLKGQIAQKIESVARTKEKANVISVSSKGITGFAVLSSPKARTTQATETIIEPMPAKALPRAKLSMKTKLSTVQESVSIPKQRSSLGTSRMPVQDFKPIQDAKPFTAAMSLPVAKSMIGTDILPATGIKPAQKPVQRYAMAPVTQTRHSFAPSPFPQPKTGLAAPPMITAVAKLPAPASLGGFATTTGRGSKGKRKYRASIIGKVKGLRTPSLKKGLLSGFEVRGL